MIQDESNSQVSELSWVGVVTVLIYAETTSALLFVFPAESVKSFCWVWLSNECATRYDVWINALLAFDTSSSTKQRLREQTS